MKRHVIHPNKKFPLAFLITCLVFSSCEQSSSPEGRMTLKLEELQQTMMDSLKQQNAAILDSLSAIRNELNEIKQEKK